MVDVVHHLQRRFFLFSLLFALAISIVSFFNYLLFHTFAEFFSILIAAATFIFLVSTFPYHNNNFLIRLSIPLIYIVLVDFLHTAAYKGMGIFPDASANLPTQLWILARYASAIGILNAVVRFEQPIPSRQRLHLFFCCSSEAHWD